MHQVRQNREPVPREPSGPPGPRYRVRPAFASGPLSRPTRFFHPVRLEKPDRVAKSTLLGLKMPPVGPMYFLTVVGHTC